MSVAPPVNTSREVRLGLVMYGGVSLAIYINGVAQEFFRAVKGQGVYRLLKALTDSEVTVDVISGTSAGGINGILLAYALANDRDFRQSSRLWRAHGGLGSLLREPFGAVPKRSSVLDSEGYYQARLAEAFDNLGPYHEKPEDRPTVVPELDLFVTGTDVDGRVWTEFDDAGHDIDVKDHRCVFNLKYRRGRKNQFLPYGMPAGRLERQREAANGSRSSAGTDGAALRAALAKLCRITSCFPVAFSPVLVAKKAPPDPARPGEPAGPDALEAAADGYLQQWGNLDKESCFLDGGVLDNKPFTHSLRAIFCRTASKEVARRLCYVEPDPEVHARRTEASQPHFVQAALAALVGIPGYESIADDLRMLNEHNSRLLRFRMVVDTLRGISGRLVAHPSPAQDLLYRQARLASFVERMIRGLFAKDGHRSRLIGERREYAASLDHQFKQNLCANDELGPRVLTQYDVTYHQRRAQHVVYGIYWHLYQEPAAVGGIPRREVTAVWELWNELIQTYEIVRWALESFLDACEPKPGEPADEVLIRLDEDLCWFLRPAAAGVGPPRGPDEIRSWISEGSREEMHARFRASLAALQRAKPEDVAQRPRTLLQCFDEAESLFMASLAADHPARIAWEEFKQVDSLLFPLEMVSGFEERDVIETVRISPTDARKGFSSPELEHKVSGDAVFHFGGFLKRSWRSNDILWGRLDGACQLVETLLEEKRQRKVLDVLAADRERLEVVKARFLATDMSLHPQLDPATLFPHSPPDHVDGLRSWLRRYLDTGHTAGLEQWIIDLVEAEQLEILVEEVPRVLEDAATEQNEWNRYRAPGSKRKDATDDTGRWTPFGDATDPFVSAARAAAVATGFVQGLVQPAAEAAPQPKRPSSTALGSFFVEKYKVGSELLLRDIPQVILFELLMRALLVVRTCFLELLPDHGQRLRGNPAFKLGLDLPLRSLYTMSVLYRRTPRLANTILAAAGVFLALALVGFFWGRSLGSTPDPGKPLWLTAFVIAPLLALMSLVAQLARSRIAQTLLMLAGLALMGQPFLYAVIADDREIVVGLEAEAFFLLGLGLLVLQAASWLTEVGLWWEARRRAREASPNSVGALSTGRAEERDDLRRGEQGSELGREGRHEAEGRAGGGMSEA